MKTLLVLAAGNITNTFFHIQEIVWMFKKSPILDCADCTYILKFAAPVYYAHPSRPCPCEGGVLRTPLPLGLAMRPVWPVECE